MATEVARLLWGTYRRRTEDGVVVEESVSDETTGGAFIPVKVMGPAYKREIRELPKAFWKPLD